ncbi:hypothetical protein PM082_015132 [Marasmius tenuissimus]|nr:hypothetical protein PM082_015132 [Marasmius tenuissimus]
MNTEQKKRGERGTEGHVNSFHGKLSKRDGPTNCGEMEAWLDTNYEGDYLCFRITDRNEVFKDKAPVA